MNKQQFLDYWQEMTKTSVAHYRAHGFEYHQYTIGCTQDQQVSRQCYGQSEGDTIIVTAKIKGDDVIAVSHDSHECFVTPLYIEFMEVERAA